MLCHNICVLVQAIHELGIEPAFDAYSGLQCSWPHSNRYEDHTLKVRATDGDGEAQTESEAPPHPSGATGYHTIEVTVV